MANHKSSLKRIRSSETKRLRNRYQHRTTRNAIKKLRETTDKKEAEGLFPAVTSMIDKLAKRNIIHESVWIFWDISKESTQPEYVYHSLLVLGTVKEFRIATVSS